MPTPNISLTREQDELIDEVVRTGDYQNASEVVRDALRALQQRRREDELKLERLRLELRAGIASIDRHEVDEVEEADIRSYVHRLRIGARSR